MWDPRAGVKDGKRANTHTHTHTHTSVLTQTHGDDEICVCCLNKHLCCSPRILSYLIPASPQQISDSIKPEHYHSDNTHTHTHTQIRNNPLNYTNTVYGTDPDKTALSDKDFQTAVIITEPRRSTWKCAAVLARLCVSQQREREEIGQRSFSSSCQILR